jgi:trk system potassium uptake protein TrkH
MSRAQPAEAGRRLPYVGVSGALLAAVPVPFAVAAWAGRGADPSPLVAVLTWVASLALAAGGVGIVHRPRLGRIAGTAGLAAVLALAAPRLPAAPGLSLALALLIAVAISLIWNLGLPLTGARMRRTRPALGRVRPAAWTTLGFFVGVALSGGQGSSEQAMAVAASAAIAAGLGLLWSLSGRRPRPARAWILAIAVVASAALAWAIGGDPWALAGCGALYAIVGAAVGPRPETAGGIQAPGLWGPILEHPERLFVGTFAVLCSVGAIFLALPHAASAEQGVGLVDAVFTAVSAVCVTGLVVRDTAGDFSLTGQIAILVLIQLGGLGIMTFSTAALRLLGRRLSLRHESAVARLIGTSDRGRLASAAQDVLRLTFAVEGAGALLLTIAFVLGGEGLGAAAWRAVFTSVSAFCNAGFALQADSLVGYRSDPLVLHTVGALIVLGGLSPAAVLALPAFARRRVRPVALQVWICIVTAIVLSVFGFVFVLAAEWDNTLADLGVADKLHNAWFQSLTLRTAGFNSIDIAAVRPGTWVVMMALMFVGGSPGGTAGGIKTTTVAILAMAVSAAMLGRNRVEIHGRRVPDRTVQRAAVVATIGISGVLLASVAMLATQRIEVTWVLFEVVSALGTVGLSMGATAELDTVGKVVVVVSMFVGRVGGLSLLMFMSQRTSAGVLSRPTEDVAVG